MTTIADKLLQIHNNFKAAKAALENKGITTAGQTNATLAKALVPNNVPETIPGWTRTSDWLALPTVSSSEEKFVGLVAVFPETNFISLTAKGNYTVNWGDGTTENFNSGVTANHQYDYNNANLNGTTSTRGYKQAIVTITPQAGQHLTVLHLGVKSSAYTASQVSNFLDINVSAPLMTELYLGLNYYDGFTFTNSPVLFSRLERFNLVASSLTQGYGLFNNCYALSSIPNLAFKSKAVTQLAVTYSNSWYTCPSHGLAVNDRVYDNSGTTLGNGYFVTAVNGDSFQLGTSRSNAITTNLTNLITGNDFSFMFYYARGIEALPMFDTSNAIAFESFCQYCSNVRVIPNYDTSNALSMKNMFNSCSALMTPPNFDTAKVKSFDSMFQACSALDAVPFFDFSSAISTASMMTSCSSIKTVNIPRLAATNVSGMFGACASLLNVVALDLSNATDVSFLFNNSNSIISVCDLNISKATTTNLMFGSCFNLAKLGSITSSSALTNTTSMFSNCNSLSSIPLFDTSGVTNMTSMFNSCYALETIPAFNTGSVTTISTMFANCYRLREVPALDFSKVVTASTPFTACTNLHRMRATGLGVTVAIAGAMSASALNELYANLPTVSAKTLTVSGNWGYSSSTTATATGKGWTVN